MPQRRGEHPAFADAIRDARKQADFTQPALAAEVKVSTATVKAWESGRRMPGSADLVQELAAVLGVDPEALGLVPPDFQTATLAAIRRARWITVPQLASTLGISDHLVREVEAGRLLPPDPAAWASALRISPHNLADAWPRSHPGWSHLHPDQPGRDPQ
jgi:DNA-binding transcriptional regulator YiaG